MSPSDEADVELTPNDLERAEGRSEVAATATPSAENIKTAETAASIFLGRVKFSPQRYSDNPGVQFCLELEKRGGLAALQIFFARLDAAENMYALPLTSLETEALRHAAGRTNIVQQLSDSSYTQNAARTLTSRRALLKAGGLGVSGFVAGTVSGLGLDFIEKSALNSASKAADGRAGLIKQYEALMARREMLQPV